MGQVREIAFQLRFEIEWEVGELEERRYHPFVCCSYISKAAYSQHTPLTKAFQFQGDTEFYRNVFPLLIIWFKTRIPLNRLKMSSDANFQIMFQEKPAAVAEESK